MKKTLHAVYRPFRRTHNAVCVTVNHLLLTFVAKFCMRRTFSSLSRLGVFQKSYAGYLSFPNVLWREWGYEPEKMRGVQWHEVIHPEDRERTVREFERQIAQGDTVELPEYRVITTDGEVRWIYNRGQVVSRSPSGEVLHYIGHDVDITQRKEMESMLELLREAGAIITSTLDSNEVINRVLDQASRFIPYDTAAVLLLREETLELVAGSGWSDIDTVLGLSIPIPGDNPNTPVLREKHPKIVDRPAKHYPDFNRLADPEVRNWMGVPLVVKGEAIGMISFDSYSPGTFGRAHLAFASMLGEQLAQALHNAQTFETTHHEATFDTLTGTLTRRALYDEAQKLLSHARRHGESVAMLMFDIDHFKHFNDTYGHSEGDKVLSAMARTCRTSLRPFDIVGRYGGEEFVVLLPRSREKEASRAGERLRRNIEEASLSSTGRTVTISVGTAVWDEKTTSSFDQLLQNADKALYEAKHRGRNRLVRYSELPASSDDEAN